VVLIRGGRVKDFPCPLPTVIRGTLDTSGVKDRRQAAPKYGHQAPKVIETAHPRFLFPLAFLSLQGFMSDACC